ncbi:MAG: hypothetical protein ACK4VN_01330 [Bacteroidales bacterium]
MTTISPTPRRLLQALAACLFMVFLITPACSSDSEDDIAPECNLQNVTYSQTIAPIMATHCNSCHSGSSPTAGIVTATFEGLRVIALSGQLVGSVEHQQGFAAMPPGQPQLGECPRKQIGAWVNSGATNN